MRLRNNTILPNLKRKAMAPVLYQRIDNNNVRIGTKWIKCNDRVAIGIMRNKTLQILRPIGVTIYHDPGCKQFISNDWYLDEEIERL